MEKDQVNNQCFVHVDGSLSGREILKKIQRTLDKKKEGKGNTERLIDSYILDRPLFENYQYDYKNACVVLVPNYKMIFVDLGNNHEGFENYIEDFKEDIGKLSSIHRYEQIIGRTRNWFDRLHQHYSASNEGFDTFLESCRLDNQEDCRRMELLISLLTNSINDPKRIKDVYVADNLLDKIKQKIILFDKEQLDILTDNTQKLIIQGLSGTGKTELLLHKIKQLYVDSENIKIAFTCHNKILADGLKKRIPDFFDFMKVNEQIRWNEKLWVFHSWGSGRDPNSGLYAYLCSFYKLIFRPYDRTGRKDQFSSACQEILDKLTKLEGSRQNFQYAFDYIFIDESQDFDGSFFKLCEKVSKNVYMAGDIFQNIYDNINEDSFDKANLKILNKCYRTDPKTLMFGHSIGMGLFEPEKINWMAEDSWETCGYTVEKQENTWILYRNPLRRFEDLEDIESVIVKNIKQDGWEIKQNGVKDNIQELIDILRDIREKNPTVKAGDIAIVFVGKDLYSDNIDQNIKIAIETEFQADEWFVNLAHRSKEKNLDQILLTNENNIKGLEFPFVIVVSCGKITDDLILRNKLYMTITRSMMQTYLLLEDQEKTDIFQEGFRQIDDDACIKTQAPDEQNMDKINARVKQFNARFKDDWRSIVGKLCNQYGLRNDQKKALLELLRSANKDLSDSKEVESSAEKLIIDIYVQKS